MSSIPASDFKAHCLQYMNDVQKKHKTFLITKHGVPVAKLVPYQAEIPKLFGGMEGTGVICGDIISPLDTPWDAYDE